MFTIGLWRALLMLVDERIVQPDGLVPPRPLCHAQKSLSGSFPLFSARLQLYFHSGGVEPRLSHVRRQPRRQT